jgi:hypothetical protein
MRLKLRGVKNMKTSKSELILKLSLVALVLGACPSFSFDGGVSDGGGNARVCFDSEATKQLVLAQGRIPDEVANSSSKVKLVEMLDLEEARKPTGDEGVSPKIIDAKSGEKPRDYAIRIISRFREVMPNFYQILNYGQEMLRSKDLVWEEHGFDSQIYDYSTTGAPGDFCVRSTIIKQGNHQGAYKWYIDKRLFLNPAHSPTSRGVAFLHEFVYYYNLTISKQVTSDKTRQLVGLAISGEKQNIFDSNIHYKNLLRKTDSNVVVANDKELAKLLLPGVAFASNLFQDLASYGARIADDLSVERVEAAVRLKGSKIAETAEIYISIVGDDWKKNRFPVSNINNPLLTFYDEDSKSYLGGLMTPSKIDLPMSKVETVEEKQYLEKYVNGLQSSLQTKFFAMWKSKLDVRNDMTEDEKAALEQYASKMVTLVFERDLLSRHSRLNCAGTKEDKEKLGDIRFPFSKSQFDISCKDYWYGGDSDELAVLLIQSSKTHPAVPIY